MSLILRFQQLLLPASLFSIFFAGTQEQEEGPVHSFETQIGPRFSRKLPTIVFYVNHSSRKDQDKESFSAARASIERFREELRQAEAEKRRNKQVLFCLCSGPELQENYIFCC